MIPSWKIKRELRRLQVQLSGAFEGVYRTSRNRRYDAKRSDVIQKTAGNIALGEKVAILLIYQPSGIPKSLLTTCRHLAEYGYSVLAVSNSKLADADIAQLSQHCWQICQRPNIGYDFGGYRDGIWLLEQLGAAPKCLILMNDSVWFPVSPGDRTLENIEKSPASFVGLQVFGDNPMMTKQDLMFGSYFLAFKEEMIASEEFRAFWQNYQMSSNKEVTLRRGERAFSTAMFGTGLPYEGLFAHKYFVEKVKSLSVDELAVQLRYLVCMKPQDENTRKMLLDQGARDPGWEKRAKELIVQSTKTKNFIGVAPVLSLNALRFPAIKKNNEKLYQQARSKLLDAVNAGDATDMLPEVVAELRRRG